MGKDPGLASALLLADARFPAGAHAHSGGVEEAACRGLIGDVASLEVFVRGRLHTVGLVHAGLAAAACRIVRADDAESWPCLEAEADARMPAPAVRATSRQQGRLYGRALRAGWPESAPASRHAAPWYWGEANGSHLALVQGAAAAIAGLDVFEAASIAGYGVVTTAASAAVRLLGLDPLAVHAMVVGLMSGVEEVARRAGEAASREGPCAVWLAGLPCTMAPMADFLAVSHRDRQGRLFAS